MSYIPTARNFAGIQFESIRKTLDASFNQEHDDLSSAYYDYSKDCRVRETKWHFQL